jgi:hypothetical protein
MDAVFMSLMAAGMRLLSVLIVFLSLLSFNPISVANNNSNPVGLDELFINVESVLPGFGGFYVENDFLVIVLTATPPAGNLRQFISERLAKVRPEVAEMALAGRVQIVRGDFSFRQLYSIKESLTRNPFPKMVLVDVDERRNRVLVGVEDEDSVADVLRHLSGIGVPLDAIVVEVWGPIVPLATLRDRVRPIGGGLQIAFPLTPPYFGVCTLGFVAIRDGVLGYVTNDHCTSQSGLVDGTVHHQPLPDNVFGQEVVDPPFFTDGCPSGYVCRYSDAVFGRALSPSDMDFGRLMRTAGLGSIDIFGRWIIVSETAFPVVGEVLNKVGRTTGWTQGTVTNTCVTTFVSGTNWVRLCQDIVAANVGGGDSGSPVFRIVDDAGGRVSLYGVLWGGSSSGTLFVFSNMQNLERELGQLITFGYSVTFHRAGIPSGVEWGVTVNGYRHTSTGSKITVTGLSGDVSYVYDGVVPDPAPSKRYVCDVGCSGVVSGPANVTASYATEFRVVFSASGLGSDAFGVVLRVNGVDYGFGSLPISMWFRSGSVVNYEYNQFIGSSVDGKRYRWAGVSGMNQTGRSGSFTVTGGGELSGLYTVEYRLEISTEPASSGLTIPPAGSYWYDANSQVVVRALSRPLHSFNHWVLDGSTIYGDNVVVRMDGPHRLVAVFSSGSSCFDFGRPTSPVEPGCFQVTEMTGYTSYFGYGWLAKHMLGSEVRGLESNSLVMDFVYGVGRGVFMVDVPYGNYRVTVIVGDKAYPQMPMEVVVEGTKLMLSTHFGEYSLVTADVSVSDGRLELEFYGYGAVWRVNAVIIEALP